MRQLEMPEKGCAQFDVCGVITKDGFEDARCGEVIIGKGFVSIRGKNYLKSIPKAKVFDWDNEGPKRWLVVIEDY